jgi:nicotinic acid mononucleotide adenylyltransferase
MEINNNKFSFRNYLLHGFQSESESDSSNVPHKTKVNSKIAVFGLSGNPPQVGHQTIVNYLSSLDTFDELWIMPVYKHIYSSKQSLANFEDRLEMCCLTFEKFSTSKCFVKVLDIEKECTDYLQAAQGNDVPIKIGTIDVLNYIQTQTTSLNLDLHLVLSTETYNDLVNGKWKQSQDIVNTVQLEVLKRQGYQLCDKPVVQNIRMIYHDLEITEVSSTLVRNYEMTLLDFFGISDNELQAYLDPSAYGFIKKERLYFFSQEKVNLKLRAITLLSLSLASFGLAVLHSRIIKK